MMENGMKSVEKEWRTHLPEKTYAVVRVDGKGFSKYTKTLEKPFDAKFTRDMQETAKYLCENIDGAILGYTQSDEISVVFSDLSGGNTEMWYGGGIQKIVSVVAAMATAKFNSLRGDGDLPVFDARVHPLDKEGEFGVYSYLNWRQVDAIRNSIGMLASHYFSHRELHGVGTNDRVKMLTGLGINWYDRADSVRYGSLVSRELRQKSTTFNRFGEDVTIDFERREWVVGDSPRFEISSVFKMLEGK